MVYHRKYRTYHVRLTQYNPKSLRKKYRRNNEKKNYKKNIVSSVNLSAYSALLQECDAVLGTAGEFISRPFADLHLADVAFVQERHTESGLTYTAADRER